MPGDMPIKRENVHRQRCRVEYSALEPSSLASVEGHQGGFCCLLRGESYVSVKSTPGLCTNK